MTDLETHRNGRSQTALVIILAEDQLHFKNTIEHYHQYTKGFSEGTNRANEQGSTYSHFAEGAAGYPHARLWFLASSGDQ